MTSRIVEQARTQWLRNPEVYQLLTNFRAHGLEVRTSPIQNPPSGTLCVYNKQETKAFRQDAVPFKMRPDRVHSAKECHMKLKLDDQYVMKVAYASCPPDETGRCFYRRVYTRLDVPDYPYVLVHYLLSERHFRRRRVGTRKPRSKQAKPAPATAPAPTVGIHRALTAASAIPPPPVPVLPPTGAVVSPAGTLLSMKPAALGAGAPASLSIAAFTPDWDTSNGGAKVMVCLRGDPLALQLLAQLPGATTAQFGALSVPAEWIQMGVLICHAPMHTAGVVPFAIQHKGVTVSNVCNFEYRPPAHMSLFPAASTSGASPVAAPDTGPLVGPGVGAGGGVEDMELFSSAFGGDVDMWDSSLLGLDEPLPSPDGLGLAVATGGTSSMAPLIPPTLPGRGSSGDARMSPGLDFSLGSPFRLDDDATSAPPHLFPAPPATTTSAVASTPSADSSVAVVPTTSPESPPRSMVTATDTAGDVSMGQTSTSPGAGGGSSTQVHTRGPQRPGPGVTAAEVRARRVRARSEPHRDRETKIRIVERLAGVESSLSSAATPGPATAGADTAGDGDGGFTYLDDAALEHMTDEKLQTVTEHLLEHVISQLTQHASGQETLMQELITDDVNGMTMLHYTCMYNYPKLVPVLLANGADPNKPTAAGQLPLHLAASHGHTKVARQLLHAGASALARDRSGLTPAQRALRNGHGQLYSVLRAAELSQASVAGIAMSSGRWLGPTASGAGAGSGAGAPAAVPSHHVPQARGAAAAGSVGAASSAGVSLPASAGGPWPSPPVASMTRSWPLMAGASAGSPSGVASGRASPPTMAPAASSVSVSDGDTYWSGDSYDGGKSSGGEDAEDDETRKMLLNAFSNMTLHDKCAISLVMGSKEPAVGHGSSMSRQRRASSEDLFGAVGGLRDSDVASVLSDNEHWLGQAMTLMSGEEKLALEQEARRIQTNVRSWLLRRNYKNMRDAARKLQAATRGMLVRKSFEVHKHKAFAALVIQKATRSWLRTADASGGAGRGRTMRLRRSSSNTGGTAMLKPVMEEDE